MKDLARLAAGHGYFSTVTYNREHGIVVGPPTIRYVQPVLDEKGALYGVIVVNADFQALITAARPTVSEGFRLGVVTGLGDHMTFSADDSRPKLFYHSDPDFIPLPHDAEIASKAVPGQIFFADDVAMAANAVVTPQLNRPFGLYVVTEMPRDALFAAANKMLVRNAVVAFVLIFLAIGIAGIIGAHLTDPLRQLADAVRRHAGAKPLDLTVSTNDEIGELALAFASLGNQLLGQTLRARAIFDSAGDGIITLNEYGQIEEMNPAAEAIFGFRGDELAGKDISLLMQESGTPSGSPTPCMSQKREDVGRRKDGSTIPIEISMSRNETDADVILSASSAMSAQDMLRNFASKSFSRRLRDRMRNSIHSPISPRMTSRRRFG